MFTIDIHTHILPEKIPDFGFSLIIVGFLEPDVAVAMIGASVRAIVGRLLPTDNGLPQPAQ